MPKYMCIDHTARIVTLERHQVSPVTTVNCPILCYPYYVGRFLRGRENDWSANLSDTPGVASSARVDRRNPQSDDGMAGELQRRLLDRARLYGKRRHDAGQCHDRLGLLSAIGTSNGVMGVVRHSGRDCVVRARHAQHDPSSRISRAGVEGFTSNHSRGSDAGWRSRGLGSSIWHIRLPATT